MDSYGIINSAFGLDYTIVRNHSNYSFSDDRISSRSSSENTRVHYRYDGEGRIISFEFNMLKEQESNISVIIYYDDKVVADLIRYKIIETASEENYTRDVITLNVQNNLPGTISMSRIEIFEAPNKIIYYKSYRDGKEEDCLRCGCHSRDFGPGHGSVDFHMVTYRRESTVYDWSGALRAGVCLRWRLAD